MRPSTFPKGQIFCIQFSSIIREEHLNRRKNTDVTFLFLPVGDDFALTFAFSGEVEAGEGKLFGEIWKDI